MTFSEYYRTVETLLAGELPGKRAQYKMAPAARNLPDTPVKGEIKYAGVLILLYNQDNEYYTILIRRSTYNGTHSGQISFPGGQYEPHDNNLTFTALRETEEEIGISPERIKVIGKLTPLYIPVSNYCVHPVVGVLDSDPVFEQDPKEVEEIFSVRLKSLIHPECLISNDNIYENERCIQAPYYHYKHLKIWGATAMILSEFIELHRNIKKHSL